MSGAANTFQGVHAARYDLVYADKPYAAEAELVAGLLGRRDGRLLDLACGTGRHATEFAGMGFDVTGVDYSRDLLEGASRNAADAGVKVALELADMRKMDLGGSFASVVCLFDAIGYPCTDEGVTAALRSIHDHLDPGGRCVVEFLHAPAMLAHAEPTRVRRWPLPEGGELLRISETELDRERNLMHVDYELLELGQDGSGYSRSNESQQNRFFLVDEMRALMTAAGLEAESFAPAYGQPQSMDAETWHVLALARSAA